MDVLHGDAASWQHGGIMTISRSCYAITLRSREKLARPRAGSSTVCSRPRHQALSALSYVSLASVKNMRVCACVRVCVSRFSPQAVYVTTLA